jgi:hypothetical protein
MCARAYLFLYVGVGVLVCVCVFVCVRQREIFHKFLVNPIRNFRLNQEIRREKQNIWKRHKK